MSGYSVSGKVEAYVTPASSSFRFFSDLKMVLKSIGSEVSIVRQQVEMSYANTRLGPVWLTIGVVVYAVGYSILAGFLFGADLEILIPYIVTGAIIWQFISSTFNSSPTIIFSSVQLITNGETNFIAIVGRSVMVSFYKFAHGLPVVAIVMIIFSISPIKTPYAAVGLGMVFVSLYFWAIPFAMIAVRYRDVAPILQSIIQFSFYMTPILWRADMLPERAQFIPNFNPFFHMIEVVRAPLTNSDVNIVSYIVTFAIMVFGMLAAWLSYFCLHKRTSVYL